MNSLGSNSIKLSEPVPMTLPFQKPGRAPPPWVNDKEVTMCQACAKQFSLFNRRHHCRGCGQVICDECCGLAPILYRHLEASRVCPPCYESIEDEVVTGVLSKTTVEEHNVSMLNSPEALRMLLKPPKPIAKARGSGLSSSQTNAGRYHAADTVDVEGSLFRVSGKDTKQFWAVLDKERMLLLYSAHKDKNPKDHVMVLGSSLEVKEDDDGWLFFELTRRNQIQTSDGKINKVVFKCKRGGLAERWREALEAATEA